MCHGLGESYWQFYVHRNSRRTIGLSRAAQGGFAAWNPSKRTGARTIRPIARSGSQVFLLAERPVDPPCPPR